MPDSTTPNVQGGGGEIPTPFSKPKVPIFLTGLVIPEGFGFCMDAATHQLVHITPDNNRSLTRLAPGNDTVRQVFEKVSGTRQRVMVAGYMASGVEPGCAYLQCYYAGPEIQPQEFAAQFNK